MTVDGSHDGSHGNELAAAMAAKALDQLRREGWAVGPPAGVEEWRRAVKAAARAAGLRVRTGLARGTTSIGDGRPRPWAFTVEHIDKMAGLLGGVSLEVLGDGAVNADDGRRARSVR